MQVESQFFFEIKKGASKLDAPFAIDGQGFPNPRQ